MICVPRVTSAMELPHKDVGCCGMRQGDHGEEPVRVEVLEVFPEGCHQPAPGCGGVDAVKRPHFRVVKGVRVPPLRWSGGWGGNGLPVPVRCGVSREGVPWGGARLFPGLFPVEGSRCWGMEQAAAVGRESPDFWEPEVSVITSSAPGPLASYRC